MSDHSKDLNNNDLDNKDRDKDLYLNRPLYIDIHTCKDNSLKVSTNKDNNKVSDPSKYDYLSLKKILSEELGKELTIKQAKKMGDGLIDLYYALYFDER